MKTVGVSDLKNQLFLYLQYVKEGGKVVITEYNKIIAELNVPEKKLGVATIEEKLKQLGKEGEIILAKRNKSCTSLPKITEKLDWMSAYTETRAERVWRIASC